MEVLIGKATNLDLPLTWAATSHRVKLLVLPSLAASGKEVTPRPAEVPVVTHLAEVDQLLRHVAGLFGALAGRAARE